MNMYRTKGANERAIVRHYHNYTRTASRQERDVRFGNWRQDLTKPIPSPRWLAYESMRDCDTCRDILGGSVLALYGVWNGVKDKVSSTPAYPVPDPVLGWTDEISDEKTRKGAKALLSMGDLLLSRGRLFRLPNIDVRDIREEEILDEWLYEGPPAETDGESWTLDLRLYHFTHGAVVTYAKMEKWAIDLLLEPGSWGYRHAWFRCMPDYVALVNDKKLKPIESGAVVARKRQSTLCQSENEKDPAMTVVKKQRQSVSKLKECQSEDKKEPAVTAVKKEKQSVAKVKECRSEVKEEPAVTDVKKERQSAAKVKEMLSP